MLLRPKRVRARRVAEAEESRGRASAAEAKEGRGRESAAEVEESCSGSAR